MENNLELYILNDEDKMDILEKSTTIDLRKILFHLYEKQRFTNLRIEATQNEIERLESKNNEENKDLIDLLLDVRLKGLYLELRRIQVEKDIVLSFLDWREDQEEEF